MSPPLHIYILHHDPTLTYIYYIMIPPLHIYILHHDPTPFCLSLVKREPTQLCPAELKLEAKK